MEIIDRFKAAEKGLRHFYTGKPCKRGHLVERFVSSGACTSCTNPRKSKGLAAMGFPEERILTITVPLDAPITMEQRDALQRKIQAWALHVLNEWR